MIVKLKNIGTIITGNTPSKKNENYYNSNDIYFIKPDVLSDSEVTILNSSNDYISNVARDKARIVGINTILVTCIGSIGKIGIVLDGEFAFNQQINAIIPNKLVIPHYLAYCLLFNKDRLIDIANAPVVPIINKSQFSEFEITINIDLEEQQKIVNILKLIQEIILKQRKLMERLDDLIKARFVEMFGDPKDNPYEWEEVNISEVVGGKVSNGFFAKRDEYTDDGNISVLGVANIVNRMYSKIDNLPRTNANDKDIEKFEVKYGDMLFCRSSLVAEGIGKASIVPENVQEKVLFECHVIRLPLNLNKCVPEYMQLLSTTDYFRTQVISHSKTATMTTIGQDGILSTSIILPPIDKQREFYCFIKQVDKSKLAVQKSLEKTQQLFDSLMQEYFG